MTSTQDRNARQTHSTRTHDQHAGQERKTKSFNKE